LDSYRIIVVSGFLNMSKKISKKASSIRTISIAIGSLSLLVIAVDQVTDNEFCDSNAYSIENQIKLS
tara:strand:- start:792 stop:992 length:201 start_codon:yes stop_codon:yes gene_type:complete